MMSVTGRAAVSALLIATFAPAAMSQPTPANRLVVALNADIRSIEPGVNRDTNTDTVIHQIFETLVAYRNDLNVGPALADSWTVADEGKTYTFKLRSGALFHNGKPVTSAEVKWTWDRLIGGKAWACASIFGGRTGAKVLSVETPDAQTVVFRIDRPSALFLSQLANIQCHVVAAHPDSVDAEGKWIRPIGTGPLKLKEWRRAEHVLLEKFAEYKPSAAAPDGYSGARRMLVDEVLFPIIPDGSARDAALQSGAVDILHNIEAQQMDPLKQRGMKVLTSPGLNWSALLLNVDDPLLANPKVRLALAHALDLAQIAEARNLGLAKANPSAVSDSSSYFAPRFVEWPAFDPARTKALLTEAGYKGEPIRIQTNKQYVGMYDNAVLIEAMLSAAGFKVQLEVIDWATQLSNYLNRKFQVQSFGFSARFDPGLMYATFIGDPATTKTAQYGDPVARQLLLDSDKTDDSAARGRLFGQIHDKVRADIPIIGLYFSPNIEAIHPRVEGYVSWPANRPITWGVSKR